MQDIAICLIGLPLVMGILCLLLRDYRSQRVIAWFALIAVGGLSCLFAIQQLQVPGSLNPLIGQLWPHFVFEPEAFALGLFGFELATVILILVLSIRKRNVTGIVLALVQLGLLVWHEMTGTVGHPDSVVPAVPLLIVDNLTVVMVLVIGIIGPVICLFGVGYMKEHHNQHPESPDKRPFFFFLLFAFLGAMFGIVFSNKLSLLHFFWELTTLCSFLLIDYPKTEESGRNANRALWMNLIGGIAFSLAIMILAWKTGTDDLRSLLASDNVLVLLPVALLALAGMIKSAQLPFSGWLLGAMVAPTPVSALLHSSTMVKAGVYLVIRMAPQLQGNVCGDLVAVTGMLTFLIASLLAISQRQSKRILGYSTVANLGLIVACAGVGTAATVWVAIFIIIFHALAKSLLFLTAGAIGNKLHTFDVEAMDNLIVRSPALALSMIVGICGMFIAPFGMLISKWAAMEAFISLKGIMGPIMVILLSYGSGATILYWTKWLGKMVSVNRSLAENQKNRLHGISINETISLFALIIGVFAICFAFPIVSANWVNPFVLAVFGTKIDLGQDNYLIMAAMISLIFVIPISALFLMKRKNPVIGTRYMAGRQTDADLNFKATMGKTRPLELKNMYLENFFGEKAILKPSLILGIGLCATLIVVAIIRVVAV